MAARLEAREGDGEGGRRRWGGERGERLLKNSRKWRERQKLHKRTLIRQSRGYRFSARGSAANVRLSLQFAGDDNNRRTVSAIPVRAPSLSTTPLDIFAGVAATLQARLFPYWA